MPMTRKVTERSISVSSPVSYRDSDGRHKHGFVIQMMWTVDIDELSFLIVNNLKDHPSVGTWITKKDIINAE
jgi:hypothetical protein